MILKEKERTTIQDLQTQEKSCIEKYGRYAQQAKDPELKNLFQTLQQKEREHYDSLERVLNGEVPQCNCNDSDGRDYQPKATYTAMSSPGGSYISCGYAMPRLQEIYSCFNRYRR